MKPVGHRGIDLPIFEKMVKEYSNLEFLKPDHVDVLTGWYQNVKGDLYHYDGTVWDTVPVELMKDLEYLG